MSDNSDKSGSGDEGGTVENGAAMNTEEKELEAGMYSSERLPLLAGSSRHKLCRHKARRGVAVATLSYGGIHTDAVERPRHGGTLDARGVTASTGPCAANGDGSAGSGSAWRSNRDQSREESLVPLAIYSPTALKFIVTIALNVITILVAVETPQVSMVWTLAGSTVSIFVGFIIPTTCYLVFSYRKHLVFDRSQFIAWGLLTYAFVLVGCCTVHNILRVMRHGMPTPGP